MVARGLLAKDSELGWLPFARWNLRYNPFGELSGAQRADAAVVDVDPLVEWIAGTDARGIVAGHPVRRALQFTGDCGRGKTTHLRAILASCSAAAYVYLPEDEPLPAIPHGNPLLVDEAQRLPWRIRRSVFRRGLSLVLGTHVDLSRPLARYGYAVRTIEVSETLDATRLEAILNRRIELARLGPGEIPRVSPQEAMRLLGRFGNDVRAVEYYLYDQLQKLVRSNNGTMRFVD